MCWVMSPCFLWMCVACQPAATTQIAEERAALTENRYVINPTGYPPSLSPPPYPILPTYTHIHTHCCLFAWSFPPHLWCMIFECGIWFFQLKGWKYRLECPPELENPYHNDFCVFFFFFLPFSISHAQRTLQLFLLNVCLNASNVEKSIDSGLQCY